MNEEHKFCTFYIDQYFFGIEVARIQEVIRYQEMTHVPLAHATISGLINLRGQIVTAINMRRRLGFAEMEEGRRPMNVIIRTDDGAVSLLVDDIGDVIDVPEEAFERPPENLKGETRTLVRDVCKLKEKLLLILNTEEVLGLERAKSH